jgi:hypothetical protein
MTRERRGCARHGVCGLSAHPARRACGCGAGPRGGPASGAQLPRALREPPHPPWTAPPQHVISLRTSSERSRVQSQPFTLLGPGKDRNRPPLMRSMLAGKNDAHAWGLPRIPGRFRRVNSTSGLFSVLLSFCGWWCGRPHRPGKTVPATTFRVECPVSTRRASFWARGFFVSTN